MDAQTKAWKIGTLTYTRPKLAILFFWLLWGDFCYVMMEAVTPSILPLKLKSLGASDTIISLVLSTIPWTMGMFLNPVISFRSDRFRSRWGRRIPFILATLPFLVVCLFALGYSDAIGNYLHSSGWLQKTSPQTVTIAVIAVLLIAFTFFNSFVNSVFWYLFNDVVPEQLLSRFMSWFRMVGLISASIYNILLFQFAETHTTQIFVGVALLYLVGFGLMCINVREGNYPPPPPYDAGGNGVVAAVKTYARECHTLPHYWYQFLSTAFGAVAGGGVAFMVFLYQGLGLELGQIGRINSCVTITSAILIVGSGWLADRIHPIRVVLIGVSANVLVGIPVTLVWLFWEPSPPVVFWVCVGMAVLITAPINALVSVWDPPLFMRLFPRSRYGQFCSANALWRAVGTIIGTAGAGIFLDGIRGLVGEERAYRFIPVWQLIFTLPAAWLAWKLFQSWKSYGGDQSYEPPLAALPETSTEPEAEAYPVT